MKYSIIPFWVCSQGFAPSQLYKKNIIKGW